MSVPLDPQTVTHERLVDIQLDGTEIVFLRHYRHSRHSARVVETWDSNLAGDAYEPTGIRTGTGSYAVYAGVMCMHDPEFPDSPTRVRMFFGDGHVTYTTMQGAPIMEWPTGVEFRECD